MDTPHTIYVLVGLGALVFGIFMYIWGRAYERFLRRKEIEVMRSMGWKIRKSMKYWHNYPGVKFPGEK